MRSGRCWWRYSRRPRWRSRHALELVCRPGGGTAAGDPAGAGVYPPGGGARYRRNCTSIPAGARRPWTNRSTSALSVDRRSSDDAGSPVASRPGRRGCQDRAIRILHGDRLSHDQFLDRAACFQNGARGIDIGTALFAVSWGFGDVLRVGASAEGGNLPIAFLAGLTAGMLVALVCRGLRRWPGGTLPAPMVQWLVITLVLGFTG